MRCPIDETTLVMSERHGIEIDYCPQCRGVWLDRGELDKLLELSARQEAAARPQAPQASQQRPSRPDFVDSDFRHGARGHARRKSWLSDLFD